MKIAVIGAANVDICGTPDAALRERDSNPGTVGISYGGVARNIAFSLRELGAEVRLIAALGDDDPGAAIRSGCEAAGIDMSLSPTVPGEATSSYLYITDGRGDMRLAVSDIRISRNIDEAFLSRIMPELNSCDGVVIDGNLTDAALRFAAEHITVPLYADAVSCAKAEKLRPVFGSLRAFKANLLEAQTLTGETEPEAAARALLACGIRRVFVSLGARGLLACEGETCVRIAAEGGTVSGDVTGSGDASAAGMIFADLSGFGLRETAKLANHEGAQAAKRNK